MQGAKCRGSDPVHFAPGAQNMTGDINYRHADVLWATWQALGLQAVCVSPGSRSAPLTLAAGAREDLGCHVALDERSGGFFALGLAKASRTPVALLCTSGTAAANYLPAVWEASLSHVPLLIVTADRPPELHQCGAPQTIVQEGMFGAAVRASFTLPAPDEAGREDVFASVATRAWATALAQQGPVHINVPLREPLYPESPRQAVPVRSTPPRDIVGFEPARNARAEEHLASLLASAARPLLVCGPMDASVPEAEALGRWCATAGIPVIADIGSGLRFGEASRGVMTRHDLALRFGSISPPDLIVHLGGLPTSKTLNQWLAESWGHHVRLSTDARWKDPGHQATTILALPLTAFSDMPVPAITAEARGYHTQWQAVEDRFHQALDKVFSEHDDAYEACHFRLAESLHQPTCIFISNSLAIRDADTFCPPSPMAHRCYVNRGANGIDGIVSTAAGCAVAEDKPLLLLTGDLAFLHDSNGLQLVQSNRLRGAAVVFNNDGGGLFSHIVEPSRHRDFERFFTTPHGLQFQGLGELYGFRYVRTAAPKEVEEVLARAMEGRGFTIIEVPVSLQDSLALREVLDDALEQQMTEGV